MAAACNMQVGRNAGGTASKQGSQRMHEIHELCAVVNSVLDITHSWPQANVGITAGSAMELAAEQSLLRASCKVRGCRRSDGLFFMP